MKWREFDDADVENSMSATSDFVPTFEVEDGLPHHNLSRTGYGLPQGQVKRLEPTHEVIVSYPGRVLQTDPLSATRI
jgi:hypothetical protein